MMFDDGMRLLIGLNRFRNSGDPEAFVARGCITSVLSVADEKVKTLSKRQALPAVRQQGIGLFSREIKLRAFERKLNRFQPVLPLELCASARGMSGIFLNS